MRENMMRAGALGLTLGNIRTLAVVGVVLFALQSAAAQQPTVPSALDFTCHGYDEGATRAYNCIPAAGQESMMPTFVPPVGSTCNGGRIDEFPAGRLVFQIRCQEAGGGFPAPGTPGGAWSRSGTGSEVFRKPVGVVRVRARSSYSGEAAIFVVYCRSMPELGSGSPKTPIVNEVLGSGVGNDGSEGIYQMANCPEIELVTVPQNVRWWISQESGSTAYTPSRSWANVTGAGGGLSAEALAALARATEVERSAQGQ